MMTRSPSRWTRTVFVDFGTGRATSGERGAAEALFRSTEEARDADNRCPQARLDPLGLVEGCCSNVAPAREEDRHSCGRTGANGGRLSAGRRPGLTARARLSQRPTTTPEVSCAIRFARRVSTSVPGLCCNAVMQSGRSSRVRPNTIILGTSAAPEREHESRSPSRSFWQ
jgi:hypothetical protein